MKKASELLEKLIMNYDTEFNDTAGVAILYPCLLMREIEELIPSIKLTWKYTQNGLDRHGFEIGYDRRTGFWSSTNITLIKLKPLLNSAGRCEIEINKETELARELEEAVGKVSKKANLPHNIGYCIKPQNFTSYALYEDGLKKERTQEVLTK